MSPLEDQIRDALRSEAARLREMRPLHLPTADVHPVRRHKTRAPWARQLIIWRGPLAAAAVVLLVAATLVAVKSLRSEPAPVASSSPALNASPGFHSVPVASSSPVAGPALAAGAAPRYYVGFGSTGSPGRWTIMVGDAQTGKTIGSHRLSGGGALFSAAQSGAADDRTFVVSADPSSGAAGAPTWYLVRITPGSADPVRVTKLPIEFPAGGQVWDIALSGDGTELAVVSEAADKSLALQVYSVATGQLQHSWSTGFTWTNGNMTPVADLSWVGDTTVGFAVTYSPNIREEVRMLDIGAAGTNLMADSRSVWSQYVPAPPRGTRVVPHTCDTPFLTGNGQAVVCGNFTSSASDNRLSAVWLAYPLATPTRPRVIGSVQQPKYVSNFNGEISVDWTNPSGTEAIGSWNPEWGIVKDGGSATKVANYHGVIGNGTVRTFPYVPLISPPLAW